MNLNLKAIQQYMEQQVATPIRAGCNHESCFVKDALARDGLHIEARAYWSWVCTSTTPTWVTPEIVKLQEQLNCIDRQSTIPSWGTYGT